MHITGKEYKLADIFSKQFDYHIPAYQRPYSWEEDQTETLFHDLFEAFENDPKDEYFLGSIVLKKSEDNPTAEVIDGQQRLTTLTILLATLAHRSQDKDYRDSCFAHYIYEPGNKVEQIEKKPRVHIRKKDRKFFEEYIQNDKIDELLKCGDSAIENESQLHIKQNCAKFDVLITELIANDERKLEKFYTFLIKQCYLVVVSTENKDSAFKVFSVMNNTGLDLSLTDILKADIIGDLKDKSEENEQDYTDKWEDIEIATTRQGFVELFSHIRMIIIRQKAKKTLLSEFTENIVRKFTSEELIDNIISPYAHCYTKIRNKNFSGTENDEKINACITWLYKTENSDWLPPMIFFMSLHESEVDFMAWFAAKMERLAAYMHITGKDVNDRIERYSQIITEIDDRRDANINNPIKNVELSSEEKEEFMNVLSGDIYTMNSKRRNYVILRLDSFVSDSAASYNPQVLTIEHVLPQTAKGTDWEKTWPEEADRMAWLHKIANLVPLTRRTNSSAQNLPFNEKKTRYFLGKNGTTTYALTVQVINSATWTKDDVEKRQKKLLGTFREKWGLN